MGQSCSPVAVILPLLCWGAMLALFMKRGMAPGRAFLAAVVLWGTLLAVMTEMLSLFRAITCLGLTITWGFSFLAVGAGYLLAPQGAHLQKTMESPIALPRSYLTGLALILFFTGVTALLSPPNNYDSMTYHLGRVIHWMQNRSVSHFPTHISRQLYSSPFAEFSIMHLYLLSGGDRLVNLVQWGCMCSTLIAVAMLTRQLGGGGNAAQFAVVFCATIPMGILQASSTQNDYVAGFWMACFVFFSLSLRENVFGVNSFAMAASLGLAILTKGTAYPLAFPFLLWTTIRDLRHGVPSAVARLMTVAVVVIALNTGHYARNYSLFGNPISTDSEKLANEVMGVAPTVVNGMRNMVMQFASPFTQANSALENCLQLVYRTVGIDGNDPRTSLGPFRLRPLVQFHEDFAVNPLHMFLIIAVCGLAFAGKRLRSNSLFLGYTAAAVSSYLLFSALLKWQPFGSRLLLPLFLLWSPAVAVVLAGHLSERLLRTIAVALMVTTLPWLLFNTSRPLLSIPASLLQQLAPGVTAQPSILVAERSAIYYANKPQFRASQQETAAAVRDRGCERIGLNVGDDYWEYTLWTQFAASGGEVPAFEHVRVANRSGNIAQQSIADRCVVIAVQGSVSSMLVEDMKTDQKRGEMPQ